MKVSIIDETSRAESKRQRDPRRRIPQAEISRRLFKDAQKEKKKNTYENTDEMEDEAGWCKHSTLAHLSVMRSTPVQSSSTTAYGVTLGLPG